MFRSEREKTLEAMLFASPESMPLEKIAESLGCDIPMTRSMLDYMAETYKKNNSGIQIYEVDGAYRMGTNPAYYPAVQRLLQKKAQYMLSQPTLEVLAIIAFKQPITRIGIEEIRGINCDRSVNRLVECGLIKEAGRLDAPGRPMLFETTEEFLLFYGIKNLDQLLDVAKLVAPQDPRQLTLDDVY